MVPIRKMWAEMGRRLLIGMAQRNPHTRSRYAFILQLDMISRYWLRREDSYGCNGSSEARKEIPWIPPRQNEKRRAQMQLVRPERSVLRSRRWFSVTSVDRRCRSCWPRSLSSPHQTRWSSRIPSRELSFVCFVNRKSRDMNTCKWIWNYWLRSSAICRGKMRSYWEEESFLAASSSSLH